MGETRDILIVGGGLNGPCLALALAAGGFRSTVIDAAPLSTYTDPEFDGRAYALSLSSVRMLKVLGLWDGIANRAQPISAVRASDGRAGEGASPFHLHFDGAEVEEGPPGHIVEDRVLRPALLAAVASEPAITHLTERRVVAQTPDGPGVSVRLEDGTDLTGPLLVGADGRSSGTAERAGIKRMGWGYDQTALVAAIDHALPHDGIADQFFMPAGPLAILPLPGNRSSIVWSETSEDAARIMAMDDAAFLDHLRPRFGDFRGEIALAGKRFSYPLGLSLSGSFVAPRLALVGDAAHGIHPIAGQGLNLGLRDVAALAETLTDAKRRGEDIGAADVLARYQSWRRWETAALAMATDGFNRLFSNDNPMLRAARDLGLGLVNAAPGLKRGLMREAAGLTGDLPRLLQGRAL